MCVCVCVYAENLTPAEQKKLRNKQRKKAKQEAMKREKQKQEEQQKQQQQQQGKTRSQDPELDGPKEEELVPDKLERVSISVVCESYSDYMGCWALKLYNFIAILWTVISFNISISIIISGLHH